MRTRLISSNLSQPTVHQHALQSQGRLRTTIGVLYPAGEVWHHLLTVDSSWWHSHCLKSLNYPLMQGSFLWVNLVHVFKAITWWQAAKKGDLCRCSYTLLNSYICSYIHANRYMYKMYIPIGHMYAINIVNFTGSLTRQLFQNSGTAWLELSTWPH